MMAAPSQAMAPIASSEASKTRIAKAADQSGVVE